MALTSSILSRSSSTSLTDTMCGASQRSKASASSSADKISACLVTKVSSDVVIAGPTAQHDFPFLGQITSCRENRFLRTFYIAESDRPHGFQIIAHHLGSTL